MKGRKREGKIDVQTHNCVGVKTRNLLQIAKCDKEIQLIRIRCRHMWLQLCLFHSPLLFAY